MLQVGPSAGRFGIGEARAVRVPLAPADVVELVDTQDLKS
jgi:hypothetical protein